jgi:hypothetical protein
MEVSKIGETSVGEWNSFKLIEFGSVLADAFPCIIDGVSHIVIPFRSGLREIRD